MSAPTARPRAPGALPKDKPDRKRAIREEMARRHPHLAVTLKTADALGLLCWAMENSSLTETQRLGGTVAITRDSVSL